MTAPNTEPVPSSTHYEVVVVGGGAAGLSAALVLGRARRRVLVVDGGRPRNAPAAHMQGFLSRDGMPPAELLEIGRAEVRRYGVEVVADEVVAIEAARDLILALASGRRVHAQHVVVAAGVTDELPPIANARERWGRDLLHCPYCHGWEVRDQPIGVLATHAGAVEHAQLVRQWSDDVVFFAHATTLEDGDRAALEARGIAIVEGEVTGLAVDDDRLRAVVLRDGRKVARSAVFIRTRNVPQAIHLFESVGCELDHDGFPVVDGAGRTSTAGVWAVGNSTDPKASVITSAGAAAAVAMAVNAELVKAAA